MLNDLAILNSTSRFSDRVENYIKYRPSYPEAIIPFLENKIGLQKKQHTADLGSGTGLFSELLLKNGYRVTCVEPNDEMRAAAEKKLGHFAGFKSSNQKAEQTGLESYSIDLISVAQAFHWMEPLATKKELLRILKPGGHIILIWNIRMKTSEFLKAYDDLTKNFAIDFQPDKMENEGAIHSFYDPMQVALHRFSNTQLLDFDALKGQLLSASYIPLPGHPSYDDMIAKLVQLFVKFNETGIIKMEYETKLYMNE